MASDRRYLGVDGGGTRTRFCLITAEGELRGTAEAESSAYFAHADGIAHVADVIRTGVEQLDGGADADFAFFALSGYGEVTADTPTLDDAPLTVFGHDRYRCDNDMVAGWAGSLAARDGINVVAGTGSIAYGEHGGGRARAGGWGEQFGDEGS